MKKIAIIIPGVLPMPAVKGGAVENLVMNLIKENEINKKYKFVVYSPFDDNAILESNNYKETEYIYVKDSYISKFLDKIIFIIAKKILKKEDSQKYRYIIKRINYLYSVSKKLKKNDYDLIILENHPSEYLALKWHNNYKKYEGKYIYHSHNTFASLYNCNEIISKTKKFICVSEYISNYTQKIISCEKEKCIVLRNCINQSEFSKQLTTNEIIELRKELKINEDDKVIIFTGRLIKEKGIQELISALKNINNPKIKLLVIGSSTFNMKVKTQFEEDLYNSINDFKDRIIFTGFVNYENIYKYYKIADLAVIPSIWDDPAPLTIIESLTCGLPIITTNSGGIPEYVNDECAIILDKNKDLVYNLSLAIQDVLFSEKIGEMRKKSENAAKGLDVINYYKNFVNIIEENEDEK